MEITTQIKTLLIPSGTKRRSGIKMNKVEFFVDHDTGNANSTAQNNVSYFIRSANTLSASAHVFVDDKEAIMCIPCMDNPEKAWHVLYDKVKDNELFGGDANDIAIGLELCYFPNDKKRSLKAYENYVQIAAYLSKYHNVNPSKRLGHFELDPDRRTDPNNALKYIGKTYLDMKSDILIKYKELISEEEPIVDEPTNGTEDVADWAKDAQAWVIQNHVSDGTNPKNNVSREEVWTMLYRAYQLGKS
ncbi:MAG: N-acetylmuramoyl-L-alanine amidase [Firmicutes bacterium HGW-Firmicutes-1]|jgi:N-acetylmuramoyl-L-alanine amidase CwlA|nr:MAG: N-acetylmuramoyl-L-alanine amidase [Firmicutes bacterium HGW-Firmicutes-1]